MVNANAALIQSASIASLFHLATTSSVHQYSRKVKPTEGFTYLTTRAVSVLCLDGTYLHRTRKTRCPTAGKPGKRRQSQATSCPIFVPHNIYHFGRVYRIYKMIEKFSPKYADSVWKRPNPRDDPHVLKEMPEENGINQNSID